MIGKHKTKIFEENNCTIVRYHYTNIVKFSLDEIILDNNGYKTKTTKVRMNQVSAKYNLGYYVYQKNYNWFVDYKGEVIPFEGNILILKR